jgi:hypothetical protein
MRGLKLYTKCLHVWEGQIQGAWAKVRLKNFVFIQHMLTYNSFNGKIHLKIC